MTPARRTASALLLLVLWLATPCRGADDYERWYVIELGGARAGYAMSSQRTEGGRITTRSDVHLTIRRGATEIAVTTDAVFVETADHMPVSIRVVQSLGAGPTTLEGTYHDDGVRVTITGPTGVEHETVPLPEGQWLTPAAATDYLQQRLAAMPEQIVVRTVELGGGLDPKAPLRPSIVTRTSLEATSLDVGGRTIPGVRCVAVSSSQPTLRAKEVLDQAGVPLRSETALGQMSVVMAATERHIALDGVQAPEIMLRTFIKPDRPIERPRGARRAVLHVWTEDGDAPPIPQTSVQRVEGARAGGWRVTIDLDHPEPAPGAADPEYLASSTMVTSADEGVRALVGRAVQDAEGPAERAEAMRRFVHGYVNRKNLGVGFGSAAEVSRSRSGDCTEHAVLLAALLRADGIPSRVASGLIYAEEFEGERGIFAYHMWTQALLTVGGEPRWVDLDPTLPDHIPFDATHIALVVSALPDGESDEVFTSLVSALGRLKVRVESVSP